MGPLAHDDVLASVSQTPMPKVVRRNRPRCGFRCNPPVESGPHKPARPLTLSRRAPPPTPGLRRERIGRGEKENAAICKTHDEIHVVTSSVNAPSLAPLRTRRPLHVWPAVFLIALVILVPVGAGMLEDGPAWIWMASAFGPALCSILLVIWWLAASRASVRERLAGVGVLLLGLVLGDSRNAPVDAGPRSL